MDETENKEAENKKEGSGGAMIGIIIIILMLAAGGYYFITNRLEKIEEQKIQKALLESQNATTTVFSTSTIQ